MMTRKREEFISSQLKGNRDVVKAAAEGVGGMRAEAETPRHMVRVGV